MTFSNPTAFFGLLLAGPIVAFYLLRVRMRRVPVSTVMFWEQVFEEKQARSLWHRLRHLVSLILQLLFLVLLVMALADPQTDADGMRRQRIVVVIDTSASMQAPARTGQSRFEAARSHLLDLVSRLRPDDEMAIITAGTTVDVVTGLTSHQRTLNDTVRAITLTDGGTPVIQATVVGRQLLGSHSHGRLLLLSDGCFESLNESSGISMSEDTSPQLISFGRAENNVAITEFQVRPGLLDATQFQTLIEISNFGERAVDCDLEFSIDDNLQNVLPVSLAAGEVWSEVIEDSAKNAGILSAHLHVKGPAAGNMLSIDDSAITIIPTPKRQPVVLRGKQNWFLQQALQAMPLVDLVTDERSADEESADPVTVFHRTAPVEIPPGNVLIVQPDTPSQLWQLNGHLRDPLVGWQLDDRDVLRHVQLQNVVMPAAVQLRPVAVHETLIKSISGDPLLVRFPRDGGDAWVLTVDLQQGDLALRTAFPILLSNLMAAFSPESSGYSQSHATGHVHTIRLKRPLVASDSGGTQVDLLGPGGVKRRLQTDNGTIPGITLSRAGLWRLMPVTDGTSDSVPEWLGQIACNATNAAESDLRRPTKMAVGQHSRRLSGTGHSLWYYLTVTCLGFACLEWASFQRRWIS